MQARKRGRPPKNGVKDPIALLRALIVLHGYDHARAKREKYSVAINEAVAFVRQLHAGMPISETEVKRILAEFRPRGARTILMSEYSVVEGEEARKLRSKLSFTRFLSEGQAEPTPTENDSKPLKRFTIRFAESPNYPRHNAKEYDRADPEH